MLPGSSRVRSPVNILGINSVYHESAAALLVDGKLVAAVEEERFNRIKHGKEANVDNPHQFPERAIRFCLDYAGLTAGDIDHVATLLGPPRYPEWEILPRHADIAAALQATTNAAVTALVRRLKRKVPLDNLCFAGGVALNC